jgi:FixJ family two-component response regulator
LARLLRSDGWNVAAYGAAREFLDDLSVHRHGCILLDVNMPDMSGPELHEQLRLRDVRLPIVYLTGRSSVAIGVRAMKQGAIDFLEKPVDADALLPVIRAAVARHRRDCAQHERLEGIRHRLAELSLREREVLEQVIRGRLNKQIAGDLGIAEKTVKVHRGRVMAKMRVRSVAELVHLCDELKAAGESDPDRQ